MQDFNSIKITKRYSQTNLAAPLVVFPLLCPVREADWLEHWTYDLVYSNSGLAEHGCVFTTPASENLRATWIVTDYDPVHFRIAFAKFTPGEQIDLIKIQLIEKTDGNTQADIEYEFTALNQERSEYLKASIDDYFKNMMVYWEKAINHYLTTGEMYKE
ncbi:MAG: hypothetical protein AAF502_25040 [Bacteroidota bacterium]